MGLKVTTLAYGSHIAHGSQIGGLFLRHWMEEIESLQADEVRTHACLRDIIPRAVANGPGSLF